jgi:UDP-GlcNAc3NAcA epimerase
MKKIVTVIGARPQFIKAAPVSKEIAKHADLQEILVHTGQHYDSGMSKVFFDELEIPEPDYNLEVGSSSHAVQTGEIMKRLEEVLIKEKPDMLLIYGDTNSTIAGALTAAKLHIPVAHVEAGLRSFNLKMPEEVNRIVADRLSTILFAPTSTAVENLKNEGITEGVHKTGDVMYDVALHYKDKANNTSKILENLKLTPKKFILATIHRAENTDNKERLTSIFTALSQLATETPIVIPLHPRTKKMVEEFGLAELFNELIVTEPIGFLDMVCLESNAKLIVTDSGGVQKEAYFHRVPCVTLRDETEWVETVEAGWNVLADMEMSDGIVDSVHDIVNTMNERKDISDYGDGEAAGKIVEVVGKFMG